MRCLGEGRYAGVSPAEAACLRDMEKMFRASSREAKCGRANARPSERFLQLAGRRCGSHPLFPRNRRVVSCRVAEYALVEFSLHEKDDFPDVPCFTDFVVHLQSLYVQDDRRGCGVGERVLQEVKDLATEAGCVVTVVPRSFSFSKEGIVGNAFTSFDDLCRAAYWDCWEVIYGSEFDTRLLQFFYEGCGMRAIELGCFSRGGGGAFKGRPVDGCCFVPDSLALEYHGLLDGRLGGDGGPN